MKLTVRHFYPCSPERYWEMYWDEDFDAKLQQGSTVDRELIEEREADGKLVRKLRMTPQSELPTPVAKIVGSKKLSWDQVNTWFKNDSRLTWEVLPTFISADKFEAKGDFRVLPADGGCKLEIDGEIKVNVRFIGGRIEAEVVRQIEETYAQMKEVSDAWLAEHGATS